MKTLIATFFCFWTLPLCGQVNDEDSYFNDNYDKNFIRNHKIRQIIVDCFLSDSMFAQKVLDFDQHGLLAREIVLNRTGQKINEYIFSYNNYGEQIERQTIAYEINMTSTVKFNKTYKDGTMANNIGTTEYVYDSTGNVIAVNPDNKIPYHMSYDKDGLLKSKKSGDVGGFAMEDKYNYHFME